jgi:hypothetical protein
LGGKFLLSTLSLSGLRDKFVVHGPNAKHVAVICENQFFEIKVVNDDGSFVPEKEIGSQLAAVRRYPIYKSELN